MTDTNSSERATMTETPKAFKHEWRYEPDTGFIYTAINGTMDEADALEFIAHYDKDIPPGEPCFMIADDRRATNMTAGARKAFAKLWKPADVYLAAFGPSFAYRAVLNLCLKGMPLVMPQFTGIVVADEAAARAWLHEKKRAHYARKGPQGKDAPAELSG